jgi:exodeoxyribonuclease III
MRVMTWNILNGGHGRHDAIAAVVDRVRPDVLALQELRGFTGTFGMVPYRAPSVFGQAVAVLVRPPLRAASFRAVRWRLHHAAAIVQVGDVRVISTHLNPFSPERRRREAVWLAARYGSRRRPVLLAGDLNSLDPYGDHRDTVATLDEPYRRRHLDAAGEVDTRAVAAFAAGHLTDLWTVAGDGDGRTVPTGLAGAEFAPMRLDYLLGTPPVAARVRRVWVVRDDPTASDHFPVVADLS